VQSKAEDRHLNNNKLAMLKTGIDSPNVQMGVGHCVLVTLHQFSGCVPAIKLGKLQWLISVKDCVKRRKWFICK
jgi:hypothetical protein